MKQFIRISYGAFVLICFWVNAGTELPHSSRVPSTSFTRAPTTFCYPLTYGKGVVPCREGCLYVQFQCWSRDRPPPQTVPGAITLLRPNYSKGETVLFLYALYGGTDRFCVIILLDEIRFVSFIRTVSKGCYRCVPKRRNKPEELVFDIYFNFCMKLTYLF